VFCLIFARCKFLDWATQAIGQQHTSPLRARCEARRREVVQFVVVVMAWRELELILSQMAQKPMLRGEVGARALRGLARDAPEASKVYGGLRAGGPQGLQAKPGGDTRPRANHRPRVDDGRDPAEVRCISSSIKE